MWALFVEQGLWALCFTKPDEIWCTRQSLGNILAGRYVFYRAAFGSQTFPVSKPTEQTLLSKKERLGLVETQSAAQVRPSTQYLTDAGFKHCFQRHLSQIPALHAFICYSLKRAQHICLLLISPSRWKHSGGKKKDTCDWPAGERFVLRWLWYVNDSKRNTSQAKNTGKKLKGKR